MHNANVSKTHQVFLRSLFILSVGNVIEYYNLSLFVFSIDILAKEFFPLEDTLSSYYITFLIYSSTYVFRPIGALIFGHITDKKGSITSLLYSMLIMSFCTLLIGLLPPYAKIGIFASVVLFLLRVGQILSMGGEYTNSLIYVVENTPYINRRRLSCSIITASTIIGWSFGGIVSYICFKPEVEHYWRIPYIIGCIGSIVGIYFRLKAEKFSKKANLLFTEKKNFINSNGNRYIIGISIGATIGILFSTYFVFLNSFIPLVTNITSLQSKGLQIFVSIGYALSLIVFGYYSKQNNQMSFIKISTLLQVVTAIIFYYALYNHSYILLLITEFLALIALALFVVPTTFKLTLIFNIATRGKTVSFFYGIGAIIGGFMPSILTTIYQTYLNLIYLVGFVLLSVVFSFVSFQGIKKLEQNG